MMGSDGLTEKQRAMLEYLRDYIDANGRPPTRRETAAHFGMNTHASVLCHIKALEQKGFITMDRASARGLRLKDDPGERPIRIPVLGNVPAGSPVEALEEAGESLTLARSAFPHPEELFALRVYGNSMTGAGIMDGDKLIVRKTPDAVPGQIVVARIDNEVTVKRLMREKRKLYLHPENPKFRDIEFRPGQEMAIQGIGLGVFRIF